MVSKRTGITALGKRPKLETFPRPVGLQSVELISDEVAAMCPKTGQPDWYTVTIRYKPDKLAVESKSCKMLLQSYKNKGLYCEAFSAELAQIFSDALQVRVTCEIKQKPRGGITILAVSHAEPKNSRAQFD